MNTSSEDETPLTLFTARNPLRVLLIDPEDAARTPLATSLRKTGAEVISLATPAGATAEILGRRIDVVILDASVDGFVERFVALLRHNPLLDQVAILLTANGVAGGFDEVARGLGADGFIPKSSSATNLALALRSARTKARSRPQTR